MASASDGIGEVLRPVPPGEFLVVLVNPEIGIGVITCSQPHRLQQLTVTQQDRYRHGENDQQNRGRVDLGSGASGTCGRMSDGYQG
jgi:hypothetical protein